MKFSYCRTVRSAPVGVPVQWMTPSFTDHVSGAQFTFTQPSRSRPLNNDLKSAVSSAANAGAKTTQLASSNKVLISQANWLAACRPRKKTGGEKDSPPESKYYLSRDYLKLVAVNGGRFDRRRDWPNPCRLSRGSRVSGRFFVLDDGRAGGKSGDRADCEKGKYQLSFHSK